MHDKTSIVGLTVALLLAVGLLVGTVGRVLYSLAYYYLRERKPPRQFQHPEFGVFTSEGDLWICKFGRDGRELRFFIGGTEDAPSERLLTEAKNILRDLTAIEQHAVEFLRTREAVLAARSLDLYSVAIMDEQHAHNFTFEFIDLRDDSRVWRVEFVAGEPKEIGFDD